MFDKIIERLTAACREQGILEERQTDVFIYGMDLFLFSLFSIGLFLIMGALTGAFSAVVCVLLFFIPLQSFGGGYHAKTHLRCFATMSVALALSIIIAGSIRTVLLVPGVLGSAGLIFRFAPVEHSNAPIGRSFRARMKRAVRVTCIAETMTWGIVTIIGWPFANYLAAGIIASGASILCAVFQKTSKLCKETF